MVDRPFNIAGMRPTGELRIRNGVFGFAHLEECWEYRDGRRKWFTSRSIRTLNFETSPQFALIRIGTKDK